MVETLFPVVIWGAISLAGVTLAFAWHRYGIRERDRVLPLGKLALGASTLSYVWLLGLLLLPSVFGPHYSALRYTTALINLGAGLVLVGLALRFARGAPLVRPAVACVFVLWLYVVVISSVV